MTEPSLMFQETREGVQVYRLPGRVYLGTVHKTPEAFRFATASPLDGLLSGEPVRYVPGEPICTINRRPTLDELQRVIDYFEARP